MSKPYKLISLVCEFVLVQILGSTINVSNTEL